MRKSSAAFRQAQNEQVVDHARAPSRSPRQETRDRKADRGLGEPPYGKVRRIRS